MHLFKKYRFFDFLNDNDGFSLVELIAVFVMISIIGMLLLPSYVGYRTQIEKKLHIMNALAIKEIVQVGIELGNYSVPSVSQTVEVYLLSIRTAEGVDLIVDPSSSIQDAYSDLSYVQLYNNAGTYEYYVKLINKVNAGLIYVNTTGATNAQGVTQIHQLQRSDITISQ